MELGRRIDRRALLAAGATVVLGAGGALTWWWRSRTGQVPTLKARAHAGALPVAEPDHRAWRAAPALRPKLLAQQIAIPWLHTPTISRFSVRALFNGTQVAMQMEWQDEATDDLESITRFRDAVAVMLPMDPGGDRPPVFMGMVGKPVYILQWKASWQRDLDKGFAGVEASYPNWFNDVYPGHPTLEQLGMTPEAARGFYPGLATGNVVSQQQRPSPVEEMVAEGFGTLTSQPRQRATGKGLFSQGKWKVNIGLPEAGADMPQLQPGMTLPVAFALWDGGKRQVGARKHYVDWINLALPGG